MGMILFALAGAFMVLATLWPLIEEGFRDE